MKEHNQFNQVIEEYLRELELHYKTKPLTLVCQFAIVDGVFNVSQGVFTDDKNAYESHTFERIFQGKNPIITLWKNSTKSVNQLESDGSPNLDLPPYKEFKTGDHFYAVIDNGEQDFYQSFETDNLGNKRLSTDTDVTILLIGEFTRDKWYDWFLLPELGEEFYFANNVKLLKNEKGEVVISEINLKKVNDELKNVTTNSDYLILRSSIGEGYAWPKIIRSEDPRQNYNKVELDEKKLISKGIKYLQLTSETPMLLGSFYAIGRRILKDENDNELIDELRHLLPSQLLPATPDIINEITAPSDKFYWFEEGRISIGKEYKSWFKVLKENLLSNENHQLKNYGAIKFNDIDSAVLSAPDKPKTNSAGDEILVPQTYWDEWLIKKGSDTNKYKTFTPYAIPLIENKEGLVHDKLAKNAFILAHVVQLPVEYEAKVSYGLIKTAIGSIVKLILGKDIRYVTNNNTNRDSSNDLPLLAEHSLIELVHNGLMFSDEAGKTEAKKYMPLQVVTDDKPELYIGKNLGTFNIKIELTDELLIDGEIKNTKDLGKDEFLFNDETITRRNNKSYLIDRIIIQAIASTNIKVTAFDINNVAVGAMILNSNSKKTGSIIDWTTLIKTSEWESDETKDITPDVPDDAFIGPDEILIEDKTIEVAMTNFGQEENNLLYELNLYEEFKIQVPQSELTIEEFRNLYSIDLSYDIEIIEALVMPADNFLFDDTKTTSKSLLLENKQILNTDLNEGFEQNDENELIIGISNEDIAHLKVINNNVINSDGNIINFNLSTKYDKKYHVSWDNDWFVNYYLNNRNKPPIYSQPIFPALVHFSKTVGSLFFETLYYEIKPNGDRWIINSPAQRNHQKIKLRLKNIILSKK